MRARWLLLLGGLIVICVVTAGWLWVRRGFSARDKPSLVEVWLARSAREMAVPAKVRNLQDPLPRTPENLRAGMDHFADHCATCHANNGSGDTMIGRRLYPKAPDMRLAPTQSLTDGEIYAIIRNGVRLTGMPAWGDASLGAHDDETWQLVQFIRHLPKLTPDEEVHMEKLNPSTPEQRQEQQEENQFLNSGSVSPATSTGGMKMPQP